MDKVKAEQFIREQILNICKELFDNYIASIQNYEETYARYAFSIEKKVLYLNVFYAPLSARGCKYNIFEKDGLWRLSEAEEEWVS